MYKSGDRLSDVCWMPVLCLPLAEVRYLAVTSQPGVKKLRPSLIFSLIPYLPSLSSEGIQSC